jgi:hypothetical protein
VNRAKQQDETDTVDDDRSGHVRFDDRGNAVWETARHRVLDHPGLTIADDDTPPQNSGARLNTKGGRTGYDPYDSGLLKRKRDELPKKKDLRALSKWIQLKKTLEQKG